MTRTVLPITSAGRRLGPVGTDLFHCALAYKAERFQSVDSGVPCDRRINLKATLPCRKRMHSNPVLALNDDRFSHRFLQRFPLSVQEFDAASDSGVTAAHSNCVGGRRTIRTGCASDNSTP